jgi:cobalt-zinc-cadmium efflux system outer membrane protein
MAYAEKHSPELAVTESKRGYARVAREAGQPLLGDNPELEVAVGPRYSEGENGIDVKAWLKQPFAFSGERGSALEAADQLDKQLSADVQAHRWRLRRKLAAAYRDAAIARERSGLTQQLVDFEEDLLGVARRRLTAGDVSAIDVRLAEADAARARQAHLIAQQQLASARLLLCELSGWPIRTPPQVSSKLEDPRPVPPLDVLINKAMAQHPELEAARAATREAHARVELEDRRAWPKPTLGVLFERESDPIALQPSYSVLGTLNIQLAFFQQNQEGRGRARVDENVTRAEAAATFNTLRGRLARAHAELTSATARLELYRSTVAPTLEENLSLLRRGFEAGEISLLNIAVARERFLQAREDALIAEADYFRALTDLESLYGQDLPPAAR